MNWRFWKTEKRNNVIKAHDEQTITAQGDWVSLFKQNSIPAMSLSSVFAAIEIISNSIAELPFNVKIKKENSTNIVEGHPLYKIFDNCLLTKYMLIKMLVTDMLLYGNGIAYIERAADGTPTNLVYCPHGTVSIVYNETNRKLYYLIPSLRRGRIEPIDVIHILKNSVNGVEGRGILQYAAKTIDLSGYTEKAALDYFGSGCHVAGILSSKAPRLTEKDVNDISSSWNRAHGKAGTGMAILPADLTYQAVSSNSKDAQMLESRLFNIQDVARFFNINPVLLGDLSHSSYSTIEASLLEFVTHTMFPYITLMEEELTRKLIKPSEKSLYIDLDENFILRSDKSSQASYLNTLKQAGIITTNEARQQLGLNPIDGGDKLMIAYSDVDQNTVGEQNTNTSENDNGEGNS